MGGMVIAMDLVIQDSNISFNSGRDKVSTRPLQTLFPLTKEKRLMRASHD
jgi:hypothetical protein